MSDEPTSASASTLELAVELTIAWLGNDNNRVQADDVPGFLRSMHATVAELSGATTASADAPTEPASETFTPAVTARKSLGSKDHIISMIDGKPYKALRRHLYTKSTTDKALMPKRVSFTG